MRTWTQMKQFVDEQASSDPQRAKLSEMAWKGVEAGLQHLAGVGWGFEIAPKGTLGELVELREAESGPHPLSIDDGKALLAKSAPNVQTAQFEAMVKQRTN